jgi:hypothetical protein
MLTLYQVVTLQPDEIQNTKPRDYHRSVKSWYSPTKPRVGELCMAGDMIKKYGHSKQ